MKCGPISKRRFIIKSMVRVNGLFTQRTFHTILNVILFYLFYIYINFIYLFYIFNTYTKLLFLGYIHFVDLYQFYTMSIKKKKKKTIKYTNCPMCNMKPEHSFLVCEWMESTGSYTPPNFLITFQKGYLLSMPSFRGTESMISNLRANFRSKQIHIIHSLRK